MGQDPGTIRSDIEETRERMGDTVEALAYKTDVKSRAKDSVSEKVDSVKGAVGDKVESVRSQFQGAADAAPGTEDVKQGARRAAGIAQENPLGLALGAVAVGFVGGLLVPSSRMEEERLGPVAGQVREQVTEAAQTAAEHGKQAAQDAAQAATQAAGEAGREHAEQARGDLQQQTERVREEMRTDH